MRETIKNILVILRLRKKNDIFFTKNYFRNKKYKIGDFTYGQPLVIFENDESNLIIGKYCSISQNVTIFLGGNHRLDWNTTYPFNSLSMYFPFAQDIKGHPQTKGDVIIGNDVWIGNNATILSGVHIADGAVIGANSLVTKNIGPYEIWGGNPARLIRKRFSQEKINDLLKIQWWNWPLEKVGEKINVLCGTEEI
jgi:acetyltransferase-like isoleucine patch superfamily enzyme